MCSGWQDSQLAIASVPSVAPLTSKLINVTILTRRSPISFSN
ncbi:hypothetical protein [Nostoc sp.]